MPASFRPAALLLLLLTRALGFQALPLGLLTCLILLLACTLGLLPLPHLVLQLLLLLCALLLDELLAPPHLFYAHVDHADIAGRLAIADGVFQEQRGVPLLLDLARQVNGAVFGESLDSVAESAYAAVGAPSRYRFSADR